MSQTTQSDAAPELVESELVRQNREQRRRTLGHARAFLQGFGSLVRQMAVHDSINSAVKAVLDPLLQTVRELQGGVYGTRFVFAAGHSFCDGVWVRCTGRSFETAQQIATTLRGIKARGFVIHPDADVDSLLTLSRLIRELQRRLPNAPPVTWHQTPVPGVEFIPSDEDDDDMGNRGVFRKEVTDLFDEGLRATASSVQVNLDIFARRRQRSIVLRLVQLAEQSPEDLLLLTTLRDPGMPTSAHVLMVTILAVALGRTLGLRRRDLVRLGIAALSHNVGETLLPQGLTELQRPFTAEERDIVQSHPLMGARHMLERFGFDPQIAERAIASIEHHRWANGQGYPKLADHKPHLLTRIISVVDVFDALCQVRSWRGDYPPDQAIKLVGRLAGSQLDLALVRSLVRMIGKFPPGTLVELDSGEYALVLGIGQGAQPLNRPRVLLLTDEEGYELEQFIVVDLGERHTRRRAWQRTIMRARDPRTLSQPVSAYLLADRIEVPPENLDIHMEQRRRQTEVPQI
jgi:HD-GYP domain-containing protein (c-di-GMP phosphodiesterase class II)